MYHTFFLLYHFLCFSFFFTLQEFFFSTCRRLMKNVKTRQNEYWRMYNIVSDTTKPTLSFTHYKLSKIRLQVPGSGFRFSQKWIFPRIYLFFTVKNFLLIKYFNTYNNRKIQGQLGDSQFFKETVTSEKRTFRKWIFLV